MIPEALETVFLPLASDHAIASHTQEKWTAAEGPQEAYKITALYPASVKVMKVKERPERLSRPRRIEA